MDENGDRQEYTVGLYGLAFDPDLRWMLYGTFKSDFGQVYWDENDFINELVESPYEEVVFELDSMDLTPHKWLSYSYYQYNKVTENMTLIESKPI